MEISDAFTADQLQELKAKASLDSVSDFLLPSTFVFRHFCLSQMSTCPELLRKKARVLFLPLFYVVMQRNRVIGKEKCQFCFVVVFPLETVEGML